MEKEIWKDIVWYEWRYQVSNLWNVKSLSKIYKWGSKKDKKLKPSKRKDWYCMVKLYKDNNTKTIKIHRLVADTFIPNIENKETVNHINWIKDDNRLENIEWSTISENIKHRYDILKQKWNKNWLWKFWEKHNTSKLISQYDLNWNLLQKFYWMLEAERKTLVTHQNIWRVCNWKRKTAWGFIWKYN